MTLNSRYLVFEAQQAHYYGLHPLLAYKIGTRPSAGTGTQDRDGYSRYVVLFTETVLYQDDN